MFGKFLPQQNRFFEYFEQHASLTHQAAQIFHQLVLSNEFTITDENVIKTLEHQADQVGADCIDLLHKSFITPFQHNDIFCLITKMDDVIDAIDEAFDDCIIYKITTFPSYAKEMARLLEMATEKLEWMVKKLRDRKGQVKEMRENCREIHQLEHEMDQVLRKALSQLFDEEQDLRQFIKWKEIYESLEKAMDFCDDVSNLIEGIIVEYD